MDRDAKIRMYAKVMAKTVLILSVLDAVLVGIFLASGRADSIAMPSGSVDPIMFALSLMMILMGIGIQGIGLYRSGGLPALYFGGWAAGVLLVAIGHSLSYLHVLGLNWRSLVSLILSWAFFLGTIVLNFVAVRKLTRPV